MRKYRLRIGLDVDDTLYECNAYALALLREKYGERPELDINNLRTWGSSGSIADERLALFSSPEFVSSQPFYDGAREFVRELSRMGDVFFVTSVPPACMTARAERLSRDFPEVPPENILIGTRKDVIKLDILLDDAVHNIDSSQASYPVLMRRPWNSALSGLLSVNSYSDFVHLCGMIRDSFAEREPDLSGGGVICLVGASGTGKTDIASALCLDARFAKPHTTTTRPCLPGESREAYHFVSEKEFIEAKESGKFIETTVYGGYCYGTSESEISPIVDSGRIAVIPIDICGALTLKNLYRHRALLVYTERAKDALLTDIINRKIPTADKVARIASLDYELRNREMCDVSVNFDYGADECAKQIEAKLGKQN